MGRIIVKADSAATPLTHLPPVSAPSSRRRTGSSHQRFIGGRIARRRRRKNYSDAFS
jgi:hypothetical protein